MSERGILCLRDFKTQLVLSVEGQKAAEVELGKIKHWSLMSSFQVLSLGRWMVGEDTNSLCQSLGNKDLSESGDMSVAGVVKREAVPVKDRVNTKGGESM